MTDDIRILMCGSRTWNDENIILSEVSRMYGNYRKRLVVIHGDEPLGADIIIHTLCEEMELRHEMYCAAKPRYQAHERFLIEQVSDWNIDGRAAGPKRNKHMLNTGIYGAIAFRSSGVSRGTDGMCKLAKAAAKPVIVWDNNRRMVVLT